MDLQPIYLVSGLAKIFPPMSAEEYQGLKESIRAFGMIDEITLWRGQVIDGLHRLRACLELGIEPRFTTLPDDIPPEEFVVGKNINRRNQNETFRAASAVKAMRKSGSGRPGSRNNRANLRGAGTRKWASRTFGVSERTITTVAGVLDPESGAIPALRQAVAAGQVTGNDARKVISQTAEIQRRALELVQGGKSRTVSRSVALVLREMDLEGGSGASPIHPPRETAPRAEFHVSPLADLHRLVSAGSINAIVTFPPTAWSWIPQFGNLAHFAAHALRPDGVLAVLVSAQYLPCVLKALEHPELKWVAELDYRFDSPAIYTREPHRLNQRRRPLLVYGKPQFRLGGGDDIIQLPPHEEHSLERRQGQQRFELGAELIFERLVATGGTVCDPCVVDRAATALAALKRGCHFTGAFDDRSAIAKVRAMVDGDTGLPAAPAVDNRSG